MEIIQSKLGDNYFVMNSMEQRSKKFSRSFHKKNFRKGDTRTGINFSSKQR